MLVYSYYVELGDSSGISGLDYVDTREKPYGFSTYSTTSDVSWALNTDITIGTYGRGNKKIGKRENDIILTATERGGIFTATESGSRVPANTFLPLPGTPGSLSGKYSNNLNTDDLLNNNLNLINEINNNIQYDVNNLYNFYNFKNTENSKIIIIDPSLPYVTGVRTALPSGTYNGGVNVSISVFWSYPVVVSGCPFIVFQLKNGIEKYAKYSSGSGSNLLIFLLEIKNTEEIDNLDYYSIHSLVNSACTYDLLYSDPFLRNFPEYIKRASQNPVLTVNLTLPFVTYRETIIAPTSITGKYCTYVRPILFFIYIYSHFRFCFFVEEKMLFFVLVVIFFYFH